jgi:hypothetical protein
MCIHVLQCARNRATGTPSKHQEGFEPSTSGLAVRRSGQLSYRCIHIRQGARRGSNPRPPEWKSGALSHLSYRHTILSIDLFAQPLEPRTGRRRRTAPGVAFARPGAPCPGGSPRGLRCSFTRTRVVKQILRATEKAPCLTRLRRGGRAPCWRLRRSGRTSPTPEHLPRSFRNRYRCTANRATTYPLPRRAHRRGHTTYRHTAAPRLACSARAPALAGG